MAELTDWQIYQLTAQPPGDTQLLLVGDPANVQVDSFKILFSIFCLPCHLFSFTTFQVAFSFTFHCVPGRLTMTCKDWCKSMWIELSRFANKTKPPRLHQKNAFRYIQCCIFFSGGDRIVAP